MARKHIAFSWEVLMDPPKPDDVNMRPHFLAHAESQPASNHLFADRRRLWWMMLALVLCVTLGAGYRLYLTAEAGAMVIETELQSAIVMESYLAADPASASELAATTVRSFDLHGDVAAVEVVVNDPSRPTPYRETRFYRQAAGGWQPSANRLSFWGPQKRLESKHFVFRYYRRDHAAVTAAAPALDAFYSRMVQSLGRSIPVTGEKVTVQVSASYVPGFEDHAYWAQNLPVSEQSTIQVPSPALLRIPVDVSDAEAIALSAGIALIYQQLPRASANWPNSDIQAEGWWWLPLTEGLRRWLLLDNDPLVAGWRSDILIWHLSNPCRSCSEESPSLPSGYQQFCQVLAMLEVHPLDLFPVPCVHTYGSDDGNNFSDPLLSPSITRSTLTALSPGSATFRPEARQLQMAYSEQVVSMVTLLEYVADTYGRERIPALLAAFGAYQEWDTLVPAVFGIPAEEFDAGWRTYVAQEYGVGEQ